MKVKGSTFFVSILLLLCGLAVVSAQQLDIDRELEEAKALYREAKFAQAIGKLHAVIGRLEQLRDLQARRIQLSDAHLHLALSYVALNDPAAAKESLKQMLRADRNRKLDPDVYAPKVIVLFEDARAEVAKEPAKAAAAPAPTSSPQAAVAKKGGSKAPLIVLGIGAAAGGAALAAKGGGSSAVATPTATPAPTVSGSDDILFQGSNPPPGSALSASSFRIALLFTVVSATELRNHVLHVDLGGPLNPSHSPLNCVSGYSQPFTVSPGQPAQVTATVGFFRPEVCPLPLTLTSVTALLERGVDQHDYLLRRDFAHTYTILP